MANVNTIKIAPQASLAELDAAMTQALGEALGWSYDEYSVWYPESNLCFRFNTGASDIGLGVAGPGAYEVPYANRQIVAFYTTTSYCVDYIKSDNFVAAGIRESDDVLGLAAVIAKNELNQVRALMPNFKAAQAYYFESGNNSGSEIKYIDLPVNTSKCATSILKLPDIYSGTMFKDIYIEYSCPYVSTDKMYYIGGGYYRHIGSGGNYGGFAIPVG